MMKPLINKIDHIIVHAQNPESFMQEMENTFGIQAYRPVVNFGYFSSGIIRFGNLEIEILGLGVKKDFQPYWYGIAFESVKPHWQTIEDLQTEKLAHTLPIFTEVNVENKTYAWRVILLKGLLDNSIPILCGIGFFFANNVVTKTLSKITDKLMRMQWLRELTSKDAGSAMALFCHYHFDVQTLRNKEDTVFKQQGGGVFGIQKITHVVIGKTKNNQSWSKLGIPLNKNSAGLKFVESKVNKIQYIVMQANQNKKIVIGNVTFILEKYV